MLLEVLVPVVLVLVLELLFVLVEGLAAAACVPPEMSESNSDGSVRPLSAAESSDVKFAVELLMADMPDMAIRCQWNYGRRTVAHGPLEWESAFGRSMLEGIWRFVRVG